MYTHLFIYILAYVSVFMNIHLLTSNGLKDIYENKVEMLSLSRDKT